MDSDTKYYLFGLLFSDGNINKSNSKITLSLVDKELIERLFLLFSDTEKRKIYCYDDKNKKHLNSYTIINTNKESIEGLMKLGIVSNKSLIVDFPEINDKNNKISFLRGVFDGDGSVYNQITRQNGKEYHYKNISFTTGSEKFAKGISECLKELNIHNTIFVDKRKNKKNYTYYIYIRKSKDVKTFFDLIYNNKNSIYLQRKYLKYYDNIV